MGIDILIEDKDILVQKRVAGAEYKSVLDMQNIELSRRFGSNPEVESTLSVVRNTMTLYAALYGGIREKIERNDLFQSVASKEFINAYSAYAAASVSSQAALPYATDRPLMGSNPLAGEFHINFAARDFGAISESIGGFTEQTRAIHSTTELRGALHPYFALVTEYAINRMGEQGLPEALAIAQDMHVRGRNFAVQGVFYSPRTSRKTLTADPQKVLAQSVDDKFAIPPPEYRVFSTHGLPDVVGNEQIVDELRSFLVQLMCFNPNKDGNIALKDGGWPQVVLLKGVPGTGKTWLVQAMINEAKRISTAHNLPFRAVTSNFYNSYQAGPEQIFNYQLENITNARMAQILFFDEADITFPSRNSPRAQGYQDNINKMLLELTGNSGYPNKGNYIAILASNRPNGIDPGIRDRLKDASYLIEGPKTASEMEKVIKNQFDRRGVTDKPYFRIKNLAAHGQLAHDLGLNARGIEKAVSAALQHSRVNHIPESIFDMDDDAKLKLLQSHHTAIDDAVMSFAIKRIKSTAQEDDQVDAAFEAA